MKSVIFASGVDHMEQSDRCRNWVTGQGFPGAEVVVDDFDAFDALWDLMEPGEVQVLVVDRLADLPKKQMVMVLGLPAAGVALVAVSDEIDTRAGGQQGAAQKRVVESIYRWVCGAVPVSGAVDVVEEVAPDGVEDVPAEESAGVGYVSRPMKAKEIKVLKAWLEKHDVSIVSPGYELDAAVLDVAKVMQKPVGLVKEWVWAVLGKEDGV